MARSPRWASVAGELLETILAQFPDGSGGFFDAPADGEQLIYRPADPLDGATPSGTFAAAGALASLAALTGSVRYREAATAALGVAIKHHAFVAERRQVARHRQRCGTGADLLQFALELSPAERIHLQIDFLPNLHLLELSLLEIRGDP